MSWYAHLPEPRSQVATIAVQELNALQASGKVAGEDYLVVDVRRTDIDEAGSILPGSINLPAHTLHATLPAITRALAHIPMLIFHCNSCKAGGRGPLCAGWYADALHAGGSTANQQVLVLEGGFKAWMQQGYTVVKAP